MTKSLPLKAPFTYFGGKQKIAGLIWDTVLGSMQSAPSCYVEPFCGSAAVALARPSHVLGGRETLNDLDGLLANALRALAFGDTEALAKALDHPRSEVDHHARSDWVRDPERQKTLVANLLADPFYFDFDIAYMWIWGVSTQIGNSFTTGRRSLPSACRTGVHRTSWGGQQELDLLQARLRHCHIMCGSWERAVKPSIFEKDDPRAFLFLDPPYVLEDRDPVYRQENTEGNSLTQDVIEFCVKNTDAKAHIIVAGYDTDLDFLEKEAGWSTITWKAGGGYGRPTKSCKNLHGETRGSLNKHRETLWLSPSINVRREKSLF